MNKTLTALILVFLLVTTIFGFRVLFGTQFRAAKASATIASACAIIPSSVNISCENGSVCSVPVAVVVSTEEGNLVPNTKVNFNTVFGNVTPSTNTSDENGVANFALSASSSGVANLSAFLPTNNLKCTSASVQFNYSN